MKLDKLKKELQALVGTIEGRDSDMERLHALERVFQLCNLCSTRSELRVFHDVIPQEKIPRLAKLAVTRSGKGAVALSPSAKRLMSELADWAKAYDPGSDLVAAGIRRGNEADIAVVCDGIVTELRNESQSNRAWLAAELRKPGRKRIKGLLEIFYDRRGTTKAQKWARVLFHELKCSECLVDEKRVACRCGCKRRLCTRCSEIDGMSKTILMELAQAL